MTGAGLTDLVAKAFETACDADGMTDFLQGVADFFSAQQGTIVISPLNNPAAILPITFGTTPELVRDWFATHEKSGSVFNNFNQLRPDDALWKHENHQEHNHWSTHILAGVVTVDRDNLCFMALWRNTDQPPFNEPEAETLRVLIGYFRRAIEVNTRFVNIHTEHQNAMSVLDQLPRAVIILGQNGQPTYQNLEATRILNKNDGLTTSKTGIMIDDEGTREKVATFLNQIREPQPGEFNGHRLTTIIPRKTGVTPYKLIMYALPVKGLRIPQEAGRGLAVLLIYDSEMLVNLNTSLLHNFYNLTRAEAALAQSLFLGHSLPEASDLLGISINTTRTQLRSIFKKVGVHSQATLMQEFANSVI